MLLLAFPFYEVSYEFESMSPSYYLAKVLKLLISNCHVENSEHFLR
jgi:hypothetical protein